MKKIVILFLTVLALSSFNTNSDSEFSIVGKWVGEIENDKGAVVFQEDGYAFFELQGKIFGGKEFDVNGKKGSMTYAVDYTTKPINIDVFIILSDGGESKTMLGIAEIINDDQIKLIMAFDGERPTEFEESETIIFNRVK